MSTARFQTTMDYARHRADMRIVCQCGRTINIPFANVLKLFGDSPQMGPCALSGHRFTVGIGWPESAQCRTLSLAIRATNAPFR